MEDILSDEFLSFSLDLGVLLLLPLQLLLDHQELLLEHDVVIGCG